MPVTELLADDAPLVRVGLRAVLEARSGIELVGEAADSAAVIPPVRQLRSVSVTSHAGAVPHEARGTQPDAGGDHGVRVGVRRAGVSARR